MKSKNDLITINIKIYYFLVKSFLKKLQIFKGIKTTYIFASLKVENLKKD